MFDSKSFKIEIYYLKGRKANKNITFFSQEISAVVSSEVELDVKNPGRRENNMYLYLVLSNQVMCNIAC